MSNKNLTQPSYNSANWNIPLNTDFGNIDLAFGQFQNFDLTSFTGTITLVNSYSGNWPSNSASYIPMTWIFSGSPSGAVTVQIPSGVMGRWIAQVPVSVSSGMTVSCAGGGSSVAIGVGVYDVYCDGTNVTVVPGYVPGDLKSSAKTTVDAGWLLCYGQTLSTTAYPYLFAAIGYQWGGSGTSFLVPDLRGRIIAGPDNMGGSAANRLSGYTYGVSGGSATHTQTVAEMPSHNHTDSGHGHTDAGHVHYVPAGQNQGVGSAGTTAVFAESGGGYTSTSYAAIQTGYANITHTGSGNPFNIVQPTLAINWLIKY